MVGCTGTGRSSGCKITENNNGLIMFRDIYLFVSELAAKLTHHLTVTIECDMDMVEERPLLDIDVKDFTAYMLLLRTVILDQVTVEGPNPIPFSEVGYHIFQRSCMTMRSYTRCLLTGHSCWLNHLSILNELRLRVYVLI